MPNPSSEQQDVWRERVIEVAKKTVAATQPELVALAEGVIREYGAGLFQRSEASRVARVLHEIQDQSFLLGMKKGMEVMVETLQKENGATQ